MAREDRREPTQERHTHEVLNQPGEAREAAVRALAIDPNLDRAADSETNKIAALNDLGELRIGSVTTTPRSVLYRLARRGSTVNELSTKIRSTSFVSDWSGVSSRMRRLFSSIAIPAMSCSPASCSGSNPTTQP